MLALPHIIIIPYCKYVKMPILKEREQAMSQKRRNVHMAAALQDAEFTLWWQTLIIQLWEDCSQNAHKGVSECETDQYMAHMPAVLNSFNLIAASFAQQQLQRTVGLPQRASMTSLVELILACQESPARWGCNVIISA